MVSIATSYKPVALPLPIHVVETHERGARHLYFRFKRIIDVILAGCLFVVLFPLMMLIAVLIKLDSAGPVLFVQERIGVKRQIKGGRVLWVLHTFRFYKFRSMVPNADQSLHQAYIRNFREWRANESKNGTRFKLADDVRVTRLGRTLRKTSLDEL